jgi:putative ABC transport system permease protein
MDNYLNDVLKSLLFSKSRTLFALLGIIMGISSLVFIVAAIDGSGKKAEDVIKRLGPDSVLIFGGNRNSNIRVRPKIITLEHYNLISKIDNIKSHTFGISSRINISNSKENRKTLVIGTKSNWVDVWEYGIDNGRNFFDNDTKVAVIGYDIAEFLYGDENSIGKYIKINNSQFKIIGIYEKKGKTGDGNSLDDRVYIPYNSYQKFIESEYKYLSNIRLRVNDINRYDATIDEIKSILKEPDKFTIVTPTEIKKFLNMFSSSLSIFLGIASLTAIVISGFVLSNIFFINVNVRTWEVGLRKALGASSKDIMNRFLFESVIITSIGATIGILVGFLGIYILMPLLDIPTVYPIKAFFISFIFSTVVGILSALAPAKKAASIEPFDALRSKV